MNETETLMTPSEVAAMFQGQSEDGDALGEIGETSVDQDDRWAPPIQDE